MQVNLIDTPQLRAMIDEELAGAPAALQPWLPILRRFLRRYLPEAGFARKARPRKVDPEWAQVYFARGARLDRLGRRGMEHARDFTASFLDDVADVAKIAESSDHPIKREAAALLRSLPHWRGGSDRGRASISRIIGRFSSRAHRAWLRTNRCTPFCEPAVVRAGSLTGQRCTTIEEVLRLGAEARNCLAWLNARHMRILEGQEMIWSLRSAGNLVAVLCTRPDPVPKIVELYGPHNRVGVSGYGADLAAWCEEAGLLVSRDCRILLADILPPHLILSEADEDELTLDDILALESDDEEILDELYV